MKTNLAEIKTLVQSGRKSITSIAAITLLIAVSIIAIVSFNYWLNDYESQILTNGEKQTKHNYLYINALADGILYLQSEYNDTITLLKVTTLNGETKCEFSGNPQINDSGLVYYLNFENIYYNSTNDQYYVKDQINNYPAYLENKFNVTILGNGTNYLDIEMYSGDPSGFFNGCLLKQNGKLLKIINDELTGVSSTTTGYFYRRFYLNTSGVTRSLTYIKCGKIPREIRGTIGKGIYLNGKGDYINIGKPSSLNITNKISIFLYAKGEHLTKKIDVYNKIRRCGILIRRGSTSIDTIGLRIDNYGNKNYITTWLPTPLNGFYTIYNNMLLSINRFKLYGEIFDGKCLYNYENLNVEKECKNITDAIAPSTQSWSIGKYYYPSNNLLSYKEVFGGIIDEVRIYNRTLTQNEIKNMFWYSIRPLEKGINEIDLTSCNLTKKNFYEIILFTKSGSKVDEKIKDY